MDDLLSSVLEEVSNGKTRFAPDQQTSDSVRAFQLIAAALQHANKLGYIDVVCQTSRTISLFGCITMVIVTGPISYTGLQFLEASRRQSQIESSASPESDHTSEKKSVLAWLKNRLRV